MDYVTIFHANLNYAYLEPYFFERTIRASYEVIFDVFRERCPRAKYVFEASGFTVEYIARVCPDVLDKLRAAIESGQCEFMGSPYAHPLLANNPEEDGRWANEFAMRTYDRFLGMRPESGWNPECTWRHYVPNTFRDVGYKYLTLDFESYKICNDKEYGWAERNREHNIQWGGHLPYFEVDPDDPALHKPFRDIVPGLHGMCRSDRLAGRSIGYFLGHMSLDAFMDTVKHWSGPKGEGSLLIVADDAEYCGTRGYFDVKYFGDYSQCFAVVPEAADRLEAMVNATSKLGNLITFKEACEKEPVGAGFFVEDGFAWHRTYAEVWAATPEAQRFDPMVAVLRNEYKQKYQRKAESDPCYREQVEKFWFHLTNAENSDGRWPPPPRKTSPYHVDWIEREIVKAREALSELAEAVGREAGLEAAAAESEPWNFRPEDLPRFNWPDLQKALYRAHDLNDKPDTCERGAKLLGEVFKEYARRGVKNVEPPRIKKLR